MIRHIVLLRWKEDADPQLADGFKENVVKLPEQCDDVRNFEVVHNVGSGDRGFRNHDVAVIADFDDFDAYNRYATAEPHLALIATYVTPNVEGRAAIQFEI